MNTDSPADGDQTPPHLLVRINEICDRFEAAWRAGRRPAAEDHLGDAKEPLTRIFHPTLGA